MSSREILLPFLGLIMDYRCHTFISTTPSVAGMEESKMAALEAAETHRGGSSDPDRDGRVATMDLN